MSRELTKEYFEGVVTSDKTKEFLVDLAKTGCCFNLRLETIKDNLFPKKVISIYDGEDNKQGLEARVGFVMKKRENEMDARLQDNPTVKRFCEKWNLFMK